MSDITIPNLDDLTEGDFADPAAPTEAEMNLQYAILVRNLERAESAFYADKNHDTQMAWEKAQAELRACRLFWRSIREVAAGFVAPPVLSMGLTVPEILSEGA